MIAMPVIHPEPHARHIEEGRRAARRRVRRAQRRGYVAFFRVVGAAVVLALPLMLYVMLTANVTSLNYKLAHAEARKEALLAATMRQEDRIAKLESRERLAALAAQLGMHDPHVYAVVALRARAPRLERSGGIALLGAMDQWLNAAADDARP